MAKAGRAVWRLVRRFVASVPFGGRFGVFQGTDGLAVRVEPFDHVGEKLVAVEVVEYFVGCAIV